MATIKQELYFNFDGQNSEDYGIIAVDFGSGLFEELLVANRTINETRPEKRDITIFHDIQYENRTFELNLAFEEGFDEYLIDEIVQWLFQDYYKPLHFEGQEDRVMFSMISGDSNIIHNGLQQGYFTVSVQTNSPYRFSQLRTGGNSGAGSMTLENGGHKEVYPEFSIRKIGDGDLTIKAGDRSVLIVNLTDGEELYLDTMREKIVTDIVGEYRYDNIRAGELEDLRLDKGETTYTITGGAEIEYRYREKFLF